MGVKFTSSQTVDKTSLPTQNVPLTPEAELHLLIGSAYGEGDTESPYGHTAVYIKIKSKEYVYDFGRYGRTLPENIRGIELSGSSSPRGEGILKVWNSFSAYIDEESRQGASTRRSRTTYTYGYKIFDSQANRVLNYYNNLIKLAKNAQQTTHYKRYKLAQDYFALAPNCTTQSLEATKKAIPNMGKSGHRFVNSDKVLPFTVRAAFRMSEYKMPDYLFLPDNLNDYLKESPDVKTNMRNSYHRQR